MGARAGGMQRVIDQTDPGHTSFATRARTTRCRRDRILDECDQTTAGESTNTTR
jgi:hypothetical protein